MVLDKEAGAVEHRQFFEIEEYLQPSDLLVWNNTKVFKARLFGKTSRGAEVEIFLLNPIDDFSWEVLARPGKKLSLGDKVTFAENFCCVVEEKTEKGIVIVRFEIQIEKVRALANQHGHIPIPPYVSQEPLEVEKYQTVYAQNEGSVAAPTAGFHFTDELIAQLKEKGVEFAEVTLHVGLGTFQPVKSETLEEHEMHAEYVEVSAEVATQISEAKKQGRRIVAVGTTTVRTLEGVVALHGGELRAYSGDVNLFIQPGFDFQIIDVLITNFHLPKSTLLVLVSAFAGRDNISAAYEEAKEKDYRFFSFGDAMLIQ